MSVRISKFFLEIMQGKSNISFHVMSYIDGDFNKSRRLKNTFWSQVIKP